MTTAFVILPALSAPCSTEGGRYGREDIHHQTD